MQTTAIQKIYSPSVRNCNRSLFSIIHRELTETIQVLFYLFSLDIQVINRPHLLFSDNAIPIKSWFSDPKDTELLNLLPILDALRFVNDVRSMLSRNLHRHQNNAVSWWFVAFHSWKRENLAAYFLFVIMNENPIWTLILPVRVLFIFLRLKDYLIVKFNWHTWMYFWFVYRNIKLDSTWLFHCLSSFFIDFCSEASNQWLGFMSR